jgi:hypothetical protein
MSVIDADGHVKENLETFSDKYLDPAFRALRPPSPAAMISIGRLAEIAASAST